MVASVRSSTMILFNCLSVLMEPCKFKPILFGQHPSEHIFSLRYDEVRRGRTALGVTRVDGLFENRGMAWRSEAWRGRTTLGVTRVDGVI